MNAYSAEQKPLISLYVLGENKNNKSIKISIQSILNQSGFVIKDGNRSIKNLDFKNTKNLDKILENSDILSDIFDAELMITLKLNYQRYYPRLLQLIEPCIFLLQTHKQTPLIH